MTAALKGPKRQLTLSSAPPFALRSSPAANKRGSIEEYTCVNAARSRSSTDRPLSMTTPEGAISLWLNIAVSCTEPIQFCVFLAVHDDRADDLR